MHPQIAPNSIVEKEAQLGQGVIVWYFSHVRDGAKIGERTTIANYCFIDKKVIIGNDCKIANHVSIYDGVIIKDKVFVGNNSTFTNVRKPSAKSKASEFLNTVVGEGVSIGANATIVGGVKIGNNTTVADGAVVIGDLPADVFAAGNPAKIVKKKK